MEHKEKIAYHNSCKVILRRVAEQLGLKKEDYDLRTNMGGPAVRGETTLHGDNIYIQIGSQFGSEVLIRSCKGRKDYVGGTNNYVGDKANIEGIVKTAKYCIEHSQSVLPRMA